MNSVEFEFLSVLIATAIYMIIGFLWYSPFLFKKPWMKYSKIESKYAKIKFKPFILSFINAFVLCFILALLMSFLGVNTSIDGIFVGFGVWLGFVATTQMSSVIWTKSSFRLYLIEVGCLLVSFCAIGGILGS